MDHFSDDELVSKIARIKSSDEYASYTAKLDEIAPDLTQADRNLQSHLSALLDEQRKRRTADDDGKLDAILKTVGASAPVKRKLQRPTSWTSGGFVHSKAGGSKQEDLSCKRQFEQVDKADNFFFDAKSELEATLEVPESISEDNLKKLKKAKAALDEGMSWAEDQAQLIDIAFKYGWPTATEFEGEHVVATEEAEKKLKKARKVVAERLAKIEKDRNAKKPKIGDKPFVPKGGRGAYPYAQQPQQQEFLDCPSEFDEAAAVQTPVSPRITGRLRQRVGFWRTFASSLVVSWIIFGVPLTWISAPPPARFSANSPSAVAEAEFVSAAVAALVESGAAEEWLSQPAVVSPLAVAYRDTGPEEVGFLPGSAGTHFGQAADFPSGALQAGRKNPEFLSGFRQSLQDVL
ncbi:hypothetical protein CYMTET_21097 [Cymbomonas tetramitiformis]|uniref:Uncharacterized protein n=1 Tax=Cymbomonas tetramitiformis TaxID=36881 RepID=A0AAE0G2R8_9CHLO|nr:hypothetical protein CYMTET_21097 [Cymbomonas tetramitiformis]